jgi:hypothetical protein
MTAYQERSGKRLRTVEFYIWSKIKQVLKDPQCKASIQISVTIFCPHKARAPLPTAYK